jgi:hypothetical protein
LLCAVHAEFCHAESAASESRSAVSTFTKQIPDNAGPASLNLRHSAGNIFQGTSVQGLLEREECEIKSENEKNFRNTTHEVLRLWCAGLAVENIEVAINRIQGGGGSIRGILPSQAVDLLLVGFDDGISEEFPYADLHSQSFEDFRVANRGICPSAKGLERCRVAFGRGKSDGILRKILMSSLDGRILSEDELDFDLASVYENGPQDSGLISVELKNLDDTGLLDGTFFSVFAPGDTDARAQATGQNFEFSPEVKAAEFDQVQSYFGASRARDWFVESFDFNDGDAKIAIRVHDVSFGRVNNASYEPDTGAGAQIRLGAGDGENLRNISRDGDVIAHEFSHHIIYRRLTTSRGESGLIHEGYSDYFAYAMRNDPYLAETVKVGAPYLRTAALDSAFRFDDPELKWPAHERAQFVSAVLWAVRELVGTDMDAVVYHSIDYLSANSGLHDAFLGLLAADLDLYPDVEGDNKEKSGLHKCEILAAATERGFSIFLDGIDGDSCKLDLGQLAADSRQYTLDKAGKSDDSDSKAFKIFGSPCGVIGGFLSEERTGYFALALMFLPLFFLSFFPNWSDRES